MDDDIFAHMGREFNSIGHQTGNTHICPDDSYPLIELERRVGREDQQDRREGDKLPPPTPARG